MAQLLYHTRACQVQSGMSGLPVAVWAGTSLPVRWLLPRVRQHSALSAVSWRSDLRGAANTQQLQRQNVCSRWTSLVATLFGSSCAIQTSPTDCSDNSQRYTFFRKHEHGALWLLQRLRKTTYLLTYHHTASNRSLQHYTYKTTNCHRSIITFTSESRFAGSAGIVCSTVLVSTQMTPTGIPPRLNSVTTEDVNYARKFIHEH